MKGATSGKAADGGDGIRRDNLRNFFRTFNPFEMEDIQTSQTFEAQEVRTEPLEIEEMRTERREIQEIQISQPLEAREMIGDEKRNDRLDVEKCSGGKAGIRSAQLERCIQCMKVMNKSSMGVHMRIHTGEKRFECAHCHKRFTVKHSLQYHIQATHSRENYITYPCERCGRRFKGKSSLAQHILSHSGIKPYQCEKCGKCFVCKRNLMDHMAAYGSGNVYQCEECGKCFSRQCYLIRHSNIHNKSRSYLCEYCGKCYLTYHGRRGHIRSLHSKNKKENDGGSNAKNKSVGVKKKNKNMALFSFGGRY